MGRSIVLAANSTEYAYKIIADLQENLLISKNNISDLLNIEIPEDRMSIGIEQMKSLIEWSKTKPYLGSNRLAVIYKADLLTIEAQNSVLKLLEEPNQANNYVLVSDNYLNLLPTVLSRCELILDPTIRNSTFNLDEFINLDQLGKFKYIQSFEKIESSSEKHQQVDIFILALMNFFRNQLLDKMKQKDIENYLTVEACSENLRILMLVKKMCDAKVSTKNALDYLVINIKFE
jgi:hypothetical protein